MEGKPYLFENPSNRRIVTNIQPNWSKVYAGAGAIYLLSLQWYSRKFFRVNGNGVYLMAFAAFSLPAAYSYSKFLLSTPEEEAAYLNNQKEGA